MMVLAIFTESAIPREGLSPKITIYRLDTNVVVVEDGSMVEIGSGQYSYSFVGWDSAVDYSCICSSSLMGSEKYCYASISASRIIEDILSEDDILRLLLAKETGIASGGGGTLINFRSIDNTKDRLALTVDMHGNRSSVVLDGT